MISIPPPPPVVPRGRLSGQAQPVLGLRSGLVLRPWASADAGVLVAASQDPSIRQWNMLAVDGLEDAHRRIERMHERWQDESGAIWAIARPEGGEAVGLIGWRQINLAEGNAELLYWLLPAARGAGIVVEAVKRLSEWGLEELGLHRLQLCHSVANPASCRVAEKAGYLPEGTMRSAYLHADGWHDLHLHAFVQGDPR
ncbi:GNAT family N-acetyltransferase [Kitasatospora sp. RB6PN24]|uniref:GNAT family N-acetyltransferase n=1 Tax=Kitasatospora humi TaxID=2893891 RepID=UPI001E3960CC|nr:GNAT family N-acetyltransferase [Kitasatospora humi]MCC9310097.1 GNAT family N-acetyltransferase [Kitasatospora humi]